MLSILSLELVNLCFLLTNTTISDIVKDFLALVIISDFDDYFFLSVRNSIFGKLLANGEVQLGNMTLSLSGLTRIETSSSLLATESLILEAIY